MFMTTRHTGTFGLRIGGVLIGTVAAAMLMAACGGPTTQTKKTDDSATAEATKASGPQEDLTVRKVALPKEPQYLEGIDRKAQDAFRQGVLAIAKTPPDYPTARKFFEDAISLDKAFLEAYYNLGMTYERTRQPEEAIKAYERAASAVPNNRDAQGMVGKVHLFMAQQAREAGDVGRANQLEGQAKAEFDKIITADPDNVTANNALALYWLYRNDTKMAEDFVKKVLMKDTKNVVALNTRGLINLKNGNLTIARWVFEEKALKEDPNSTEAWTNLGLTYLKMGKTPQGVASFEKALTIDADNVEASMNLAAVYLEYLNYQASLDRYEAVLKMMPNNLEALIGSGSCLQGLRRPKEAVERWEKALQLDPRRHVLYARIGKVYETLLNEPDKAIASYEQYVRLANAPATDPVAAKLTVLKEMKAMGGMKAPEPEPTPAPAPAPAPVPDAPGATPVPETKTP